MKNNFKRNFINEFNNTNDNSEQKETLKSKLDLVPSIDDELHFKKKQFYRLSTLVAVLLVLITSVVTFTITSYGNFEKIQNKTQDEELEYFKELYGADNVKLITRASLIYEDYFSIILVQKNTETKIVISFQGVKNFEKYEYEFAFSLNDEIYNQSLICDKKFYEYQIYSLKETTFSFNIKSFDNIIFEFCTKI